MARIAYNVFVTDTKPPRIKILQVSPVSDSAAVLWQTNEASGTVYWMASTNPTESQATLEGSSSSAAVNITGQQIIDVTGLTELTAYYVHVMQEDAQGNKSLVASKAFVTIEAPAGTTIVVNNDASFLAAIAAGTYDVIEMAAGNYTTAVNDALAGEDRTSLPLTIRGQNPLSKPIMVNVQMSIILAQHIKLQDMIFLNTGSMGSGSNFLYDLGGQGNSGYARFMEFDGLDFVNPMPSDLYNPIKTATYGDNQARCFRLSNYQTHTFKINNCKAYWPYQFADIVMNGEIEITHNEMRGMYFDGIRYFGVGDEGRVAGNKLVAWNLFYDCIGLYNEKTSTSPHPDWWQGINNGSLINNTNPRVEDLIFYQNKLCPGVFRGINIQAGLTQSTMHNVAYVENLWLTNANNHAISFEAGLDGAIVERNTLEDSKWSKGTWIRVFKARGQLIAKDNFHQGGFSTAPASRPDLFNFETYRLESINNLSGYTRASVFVGPSAPAGIEATTVAFTPKPAYAAYGALTIDAAFKNLPHVPMKSAAPTITGGSGSITIDVINLPYHMVPTQAAMGGTTYTRVDLQYRAPGGSSWTTFSNVAVGQSKTVPAGTWLFATRHTNSSGDGLWSKETGEIVVT